LVYERLVCYYVTTLINRYSNTSCNIISDISTAKSLLTGLLSYLCDSV